MTDTSTLRSRLSAYPGATEDFPFDADTLVLKVSGKMFVMTGLEEAPPRVTRKTTRTTTKPFAPLIQPSSPVII